MLKPGGKFAIMVEVADENSKWVTLVDGMKAYTPEKLQEMLTDAGFLQTEIHRKRPSYATVIGVKH